MVEEALVLVVGTGCSICHAVLCDHAAVIGSQHPLIVDVRLMRMVENDEWDTVREFLGAAVRRWREAEEGYRNVNADAPRDAPILPFLLTSEKDYIAKGVYDKLDEMGEGKQ